MALPVYRGSSGSDGSGSSGRGIRRSCWRSCWRCGSWGRLASGRWRAACQSPGCRVTWRGTCPAEASPSILSQAVRRRVCVALAHVAHACVWWCLPPCSGCDFYMCSRFPVWCLSSVHVDGVAAAACCCLLLLLLLAAAACLCLLMLACCCSRTFATIPFLALPTPHRRLCPG